MKVTYALPYEIPENSKTSIFFGALFIFYISLFVVFCGHFTPGQISILRLTYALAHESLVTFRNSRIF